MATVNNQSSKLQIDTIAISSLLSEAGLIDHPLSKYNTSIDGLNKELADRGLCPLLFFAYGKHQPTSTLQQLLSLVELSVFYLYSKIKINKKSSISLTANHVVKIPTNYADTHFKLRSEHSSYMLLFDTPLKNHIPQHWFNTETHTLKRDYIAGKTGHELLQLKSALTRKQLRQLEYIYNNALRIAEKNLYLDIHPGNFCWSEHENKWYFFDLGPIPEICFLYYRHSGIFSDYLEKVWYRRIENMANIPIRSVNLLV